MFCTQCGKERRSESKEKAEPRFIRKGKPAKATGNVQIGKMVWATVCLIIMFLYVRAGVCLDDIPMIISMSGFFGILSVMFWVLACSPKASLYVLDKDTGLTKEKFVAISLAAALIVGGVGAALGSI